MDNQACIELDLDWADRLWIENCAWRNAHSGVTQYKGRAQEGFIGYINQNPLLFSVLSFFIGGIAFCVVGSILF
jgi:hypothetical protein